MSDAFDWIGNHAARFVNLTVERVRLFWFPDFGLGRAAWPIWLITLLGFAGLARSAGSNKPAAILLGSLLVVYPLAYYPVQHVPRCRRSDIGLASHAKSNTESPSSPTLPAFSPCTRFPPHAIDSTWRTP